MAKQTVNNGDSGLTARGKINDNFTELYDTTLKSIGTTTLTGDVRFDGAFEFNINTEMDVILGSQTGYVYVNGPTLFTSDDVVFGGSTGAFIGAAYDVDYSANFGLRSIVDKGYVDTAVSDVRLKENITDLSESTPLIMALRPVEFDMKKDGEHKAGFIAQELQEVFPNMVIEDDGILKIKKDQIIPYLVKCIQELKAEIELLKAR